MPDVEITGGWSPSDVGAFLRDTVIPVRLSAISPSGWPVVVSLWYVLEDGLILCASQSNARIVKLLKSNPKCGFEVAGESPPYFGVRGQGLAELRDDIGGDILHRLVDRYLGVEDTDFRRWLLARSKNEVAIAIRPLRFMSWDYRQRMSTSGPGRQEAVCR